MEKTFSMIKPDGVERKLIGTIIHRIEQHNLKITQMRMINMNAVMASAFYQEHKERPFFNQLVEFMTSGPMIALVLEGKNAVAAYRALIGATNPEQADEGTIRRDYMEQTENRDLSRNLVHGSDSLSSAAREVAFFFSEA